jgi:hypothetical protein
MQRLELFYELKQRNNQSQSTATKENKLRINFHIELTVS